MWPRLFELHVHGLYLALPTYGALAAVGFGLALWFMARTARRQGLSDRDVMDIGLWLLAAGIVGARLLFVLLHAESYAEECFGPTGRGPWRIVVECTRVLQLWEGGLVFYGGFLFAVPAAVWLARRRGVDFFRLADIVAPGLAVAHFFGRLGCFSAGCCWGKVCRLPLGVRFPADSLSFRELAMQGQVSMVALHTPPLHPTQLYEAVGELGIFAALVRLTPRKRFDGQVLLTYVSAYAVLRFLVEIFRGDAGRGFVVRLATPGLNRFFGLDEGAPTMLSTSQMIGLLALVAVAILWPRLRRRTAALAEMPPAAEPSAAE